MEKNSGEYWHKKHISSFFNWPIISPQNIFSLIFPKTPKSIDSFYQNLIHSSVSAFAGRSQVQFAQALAIELVELVCSRCNILKYVPNSALWLLRFPVAAEKRLCVYVAVQGLQPNQIIFTDVAMRQEHIRRSSLADLLLNM
ncbi:uncharacterized protein LOC107842462 isoform X2 [Capsicum annuum]|uniref:uncharacterized protein LOC107842462 isoform X2 n=1 Tax=Capsicum annuum TaxID=4072 RepID=UPI001FB14490|nr:uncharacterized protein LOC107842462 isoform X2 [Capsicum annuum]